MNANQYLHDKAVSHQIFVQRFAGKQVSDLLKHFAGLESELVKLATGPKVNKRSIAKVEALIGSAISKIETEFGTTLEEFAEYESAFYQTMLQTAVATSATIKAKPHKFNPDSLMNLDPSASGGITISDAFKQFKSKRNKDFKKIIKDAVKGSKSSRGVAREIIKAELKEANLKSKKAVKMLSLQMRHKAETLIRTSVNHVGSEAREQVFKDNSDIFLGYVYTATIDSRTTIICADRSNNFYKADDKSRPPLPAHWNCRSLYVGRLKGEPIANSSDYSKLLKRRSKEFQEEVLGKERAKLFRSGKITFDKFVDDSGKKYKIKTLKELDNQYNIK